MSNVDKLLVVQEKDIRIREIERELHDIPTRQGMEQRRLEEHKASLAAAQERLKGLQSQIRQIDLEIEAGRERIARLRTQQVEIKTNREFKAMESEIGGVQNQIRGHEDRQLALMEDVESANREIAQRRAELQDEETAVGADVKVLDERAADLRARLRDLQADRAAAAAQVDGDWLSVYERINTRRDFVLAKLQDGVCGGCHMKLRPSAHHDVRKQGMMVSCDFCGRLLY